MALHTIDVDQHLFESRTTWSDHIDPAHRSDALSIDDDDGGWPWLTWRGNRLTPLEVPIPERSDWSRAWGGIPRNTPSGCGPPLHPPRGSVTSPHRTR